MTTAEADKIHSVGFAPGAASRTRRSRRWARTREILRLAWSKGLNGEGGELSGPALTAAAATATVLAVLAVRRATDP